MDAIYIVLIAIILGAVLWVNRRRVRALPIELRVRASSDHNLTGAKFHWGPYERRGYAIAATAVSLVLAGALVLAWQDLDSVLRVALFTWFMLFGILLSFSFYYDRCLWTARTLKVWGLDPIPWNGNMAVWERKVGKMAHADALSEDTAPSGYKEAAKKTTMYGIHFESPPDGWWTSTPPRDGYIVAAPLIHGADSTKSVLAQKGDGDGKEADPQMIGVGTGYWDGYQYDVRGIPHIYLLGKKGLSSPVDDPHVRRMIDGLDPDLRAFIYAKSPTGSRQAWYAPVVFIEEVPDGAGKPALKAPDSTVVLANMDLRAELERVKETAEETATFYRRQIGRMGG